MTGYAILRLEKPRPHGLKAVGSIIEVKVKAKGDFFVDRV